LNKFFPSKKLISKNVVKKKNYYLQMGTINGRRHLMLVLRNLHLCLAYKIHGLCQMITTSTTLHNLKLTQSEVLRKSCEKAEADLKSVQRRLETAQDNLSAVEVKLSTQEDKVAEGSKSLESKNNEIAEQEKKSKNLDEEIKKMDDTIKMQEEELKKKRGIKENLAKDLKNLGCEISALEVNLVSLRNSKASLVSDVSQERTEEGSGRGTFFEFQCQKICLENLLGNPAGRSLKRLG
jgi:DNA repair ATPase RecN